MGGVLDEFRAQRDAVEDVRVRLGEVAGLLTALSAQARALTQDTALRALVKDEQAWLARSEALVRQVAQFREAEARGFWPATWRRWAMAMALVVAAALAAGAGYVWAARPYEAALADLRDRAAFGDAVAARVVQMTPDEQKRMDALMRWTEPKK